MGRNRFERLLELDPAERRLAIRAVSWLAFVRVSLIVFPARVVVRAPDLRARIAGSPPEPSAVDRAVRRAAPFVPGSKCLARSIAAAVLLAGGSELPVIRFAVRRTGGRLAAHAWVELAGELAAGDPPADGFVSMSEFPG